jgi:CDP-paratose 2-epimerase
MSARDAVALGLEFLGRDKPVLITGGAGFIGTNLAHRIAAAGVEVLIYDALVRPGVERNLAWLRAQHGARVHFEHADTRDAERLRAAVARAGWVYHFAAQGAVTSSLEDPRHDFDVNLGGAINLLEAARACDEPPPVVFTSTNKVYGSLDYLRLQRHATRYVPTSTAMRRSGISEACPLDFHSPYGCSKGAADQYVLDYARSYGLATAVFRMSCIYGRHQHGTEGQGWVAHFVLRALRGEPLTIYGDGLQVRDVLFADDLVDALLLAQARMPALRGQAFNIGGGPDRAVSLIEIVDLIERLHGRPVAIEHGEWRAGDQRYFVSDTRKFRQATGWTPQYSAAAGVAALFEWLSTARDARLRGNGRGPAQPEATGGRASPVRAQPGRSP